MQNKEIKCYTARPQLELNGVGLSRGNRWIVRDISWTLARGQTAALLGPNGSGKSTITRLVMGYLWATVGQIRVADQMFGESDLNELRRNVRLVQPNGPFDAEPTMTLRQTVQSGVPGTIGLYEDISSTDVARADDLIARVGLNGVKNSLYGNLSTGERVRTQLARALVGRPNLLILDEPSAGLDVRAREDLIAVLDRLAQEPHGTTTIIVTHHIEELPRATSDVLLLSEGLIAGHCAPEAVLKDDLLSEVFKCPVKVRQDRGRFQLDVNVHDWDDLV